MTKTYCDVCGKEFIDGETIVERSFLLTSYTQLCPQISDEQIKCHAHAVECHSKLLGKFENVKDEFFKMRKPNDN